MSEPKRSEKLRRRIENEVRQFAREHDLWQAGGRLLVAVSGGPDSSALLVILSRLGERAGLALTAAYFDHQLRGEAASKAERRAVESLAAALGVPLLTGAADVRGAAKARKLSLEDAARRSRYEFLAGAARASGSSQVATGHTASDQAETVFMHVLRGAGLAGLSGMAPRSAWPFPGHRDLALVRPLLVLEHDETLAYCKSAGIEPVDDTSNQSMEFGRNRVRHELLPALRRFNPRVDAALVRLADAARLDLHYLETAAAAGVHIQQGRIELDRDWVEEQPAALLRHALRLSLKAAAEGGDSASERHLRVLERLVRQGRTGDRLDLPAGVSAQLSREALMLRRGPPAAVATLPDAPTWLTIPGEARFGPLQVSAGVAQAALGVTFAEVDVASLGDNVSVRRRRAGDRFQPRGLSGTKKLQDFLVDAHVPRAERDSIPIFVNDRGIVWVGGLRIADWAKPRTGAPTVTLSYRLA